MKILKKIVLLFGILIGLLCALILLCAANPDITGKLANLVGQEKEEAEEDDVPEEAEEQESPPTAEETEDETVWEVVMPDEPEREYTGASQPTKAKGAGGYEIPSEADVIVPEAVTGKAGYQPITETSEEVPYSEDGEYVSPLGYGETGDGLSFDAAFYPYYQMLDEKGQHLYRQVYANAVALNDAFAPIEEISVDDVRNVVEAVYNDHPELFWLNTAFACKYDQDRVCVELGIDFNETADDLAEAKRKFDNRTNELLTQVQNLGSDFDKERYLHDLLVSQIVYNSGAKMNQSAYSAMVEGESVCAGYARAMQYLMQKLGIPCYYCTGYAGEDHAWNIVRLDDGYYNVDLTWDDTPGGEYDYFNKTDQDYEGTHVRRSLSVNLPPCNGQRYRNLMQSSGNNAQPSDNAAQPSDDTTPSSDNTAQNNDDKESALRSIADVGIPENEIKTTIQQYYDDCYARVVQGGIGNYSFSNVIQGQALYQEWEDAYKSNTYRQAYADRAMETIGAAGCHMQMRVEPLQGDRYLVTHTVKME